MKRRSKSSRAQSLEKSVDGLESSPEPLTANESVERMSSLTVAAAYGARPMPLLLKIHEQHPPPKQTNDQLQRSTPAAITSDPVQSPVSDHRFQQAVQSTPAAPTQEVAAVCAQATLRRLLRFTRFQFD
ncbi:unnamed protein product [Ilex paraguariensis]|uniref:Uncharacterized protein n=1 Tax=Ilex paraguariensis TaxID=185542 RepID=A0ABC8TRL5_9AQUA